MPDDTETLTPETNPNGHSHGTAFAGLAPSAGTGEETGFPVVGVGASAHGLEALREFFGGVGEAPGMAFVVVQHLAPDEESQLPSLLADHTELEVVEARDGETLEPNHVYVIPPDEKMSVDRGELCLQPLGAERHRPLTVDFLFASIAKAFGELAVGVVLSGTGDDGTQGLQTIRRAGGLTMVQAPDSAGSSEMPRHAVDAGAADVVSPPEALAGRLVELTVDDHWFGLAETVDDLDTEASLAFEDILARVQSATGHNFSKYKRPTLLRRIGRRMRADGVDSLQDYVDVLAEQPEKIESLVGTLTVGVTQFFRDADRWESLRHSVLPGLLSDKSFDDEFRVWVPACASGEEAYSVTMSLLDQMSGDAPTLKVFATDIDEEALDVGRRALYSASLAEDIPVDLRTKYTTRREDTFRLTEQVRSKVLFGTQNVLEDPPFTNLDLILCRNLLIYLQPSAQRHAFQSFSFGLRDSGLLMLGDAESASAGDEWFQSIDDDHHVFRLHSSANLPPASSSTASLQFERRGLDTETAARNDAGDDISALHHRAAAEHHAPPSLLVDEEDRVLHVLGDIDPYLGISEGEPSSNLFEMVHTGLRPQLRSMVYEVLDPEASSASRTVQFETDKSVRLEARPVEGTDDRSLVEVVFRPHPDDAPLDSSDVAEDVPPLVDQLERQLEETRDQLQETVERYESSNQQLKASNEELLTMNEELQSTSDELEASKAEVESTNKELTTVNEELNKKIDELNTLNDDLQNMIRATRIGTIFLNPQLEIERFTDPATQYFNLLDGDAGRPFERARHRLDTDTLHEDAREVLETLDPVEREVRTDDGDDLLVRIYPYRTGDDEVEGVVLTFIDISERKAVERQLAAKERKLRTVFENAGDAIFVYKLDDAGAPGPFLEVNSVAEMLVGCDRDTLLEMTIEDVLDGDDFDVDDHLDRLADEGHAVARTEIASALEEEPTHVEIHSRCDSIDGDRLVVEVLRDRTDQKRYEEALKQAKENAENLAEMRSMLLSTLSHDVRSPLSSITALASTIREDDVDEDPERLVAKIEEAADELQSQLDSVLRTARLDEGDTIIVGESFDLTAKVQEAVFIHESLCRESGLELEYDGPGESVPVELDPTFVTRILNNLVENAIEYTDDGSIVVRLTPRDETVVLEVEDTGRGIFDEQLEVILDTFKSSSRAPDLTGGIGLGLAITDLLVDALDGTIDVETSVGDGSKFTVTLPRRPDLG